MEASNAEPTSIAPAAAGARCFHCDEAIPAGARFGIQLDGETRPMCCAGCEAVAQTIIDAGLTDYYRLRSASAPRAEGLVPDLLQRAELFERPAVAASSSRPAGAHDRELTLIVDGISCAACAWLVERTLAGTPGVREAAMNYATHRARVCYDPGDTTPGAIIAGIASLGYRGEPYDPSRGEAALETERRDRLRRLGMAGLFGMQVMMVAVVLYAGEWWGMEPHHQSLFRWVSLALCLPVIAYSAAPIFRAAVRGLVNGAPGMDLPVALGLSLAFAGSVHATLGGAGHVYFDSVVMFTFLLLLARHLEFLSRRRSWQRIETLVNPGPEHATRLRTDGEPELVPVAELAVGDRVRVRPGESIPADGVIAAGNSQVDEALLSGESRALPRGPGDEILAGAVNGTGPLEFVVERVGAEMTVSRILSLAEKACAARPRIARLADRTASVFVVAVVTVAAAVAFAWWRIDPALALAATVSVLVVTCPCALSLATPTALTAATGALTATGLVPAQGLALEDLSRVNHVVFDKTGTLTRGAFRLLEVHSPDPALENQLLRIAAAIERHSEHPIAAAIVAAVKGPVPSADRVRVEAGRGICAEVAGETWWLGAPHWVREASGCAPVPAPDASTGLTTTVMLGSSTGKSALLCLGDSLRDGAHALVRGLRERGLGVSLYSGDDPAVVQAIASSLDITDARGGLLPAEKLACIEALNAGGRITAMVGDGINDAPVLAGASVSVAMGSGARAAHASADFILVTEQLPALLTAMDLARQTRRTIAANLAWAIGYNLVALPLAALGLVAPWMAAVGMSASSLLVVANSMRLGRRQPGSESA